MVWLRSGPRALHRVVVSESVGGRRPHPYKRFYLGARGEINLVRVGRDGNRGRTWGRQQIAGWKAVYERWKARRTGPRSVFLSWRD